MGVVGGDPYDTVKTMRRIEKEQPSGMVYTRTVPSGESDSADYAVPIPRY